jgi:hypothetical protein
VDRPDDAAQTLEASLAIFEALGATGPTQYCLVELGRALLRLNRPEHAVAMLLRARGLVEPFDPSLRSDIDALLEQAGSLPALALDLG